MTKKKKPSPWVRVFSVESDSEPGKQHAIERHQETGTMRCACMSYRFSSPRGCKHLDAYHAGETGFAVPTMPTREHQTMVISKGETFTFRRGISFGPLPTS